MTLREFGSLSKQHATLIVLGKVTLRARYTDKPPSLLHVLKLDPEPAVCPQDFSSCMQSSISLNNIVLKCNAHALDSLVSFWGISDVAYA